MNQPSFQLNTLLCGAVLAGCATVFTTASHAADTVSFTTGPAKTTIDSLVECSKKGSRISAVGTIKSDDGLEWVVPAQTAFTTAEKAYDLYNECGGIQHDSVQAVDLQKVPLMDAGGDEEFVAYIFADNYFELYVNGTLLAVDAVPFTPFNSSVVRFKAQRPLQLAVKMVDWEENLGLGSESNRGSNYHPGDGGLVAVFKDAKGDTAAITDSSWKAQTFYTAPLNDRSCLQIKDNVRDSSSCEQSAADDATGYSAAHWLIPEQWMLSTFDDTSWPNAVEYSNDTVGVNNKPAYTQFADVFDNADADATFIWSSNLVLDNLILLRKTVD